MAGGAIRWQEFPPVGPGQAADIVQAVRDGRGRWRFDHGLRPWLDFGTAATATMSAADLDILLGQPIAAMHFWAGAWVIEQGGLLYMLDGNPGTGGLDAVIRILDRGRHVLDTDDPPPQFVEWGDRLFVLNGHDAPILLDKDGSWRPAFHAASPGAPRPVPFDLAWFADPSANRKGTSTPFFPPDDAWGLGDSNDQNHFVYGVTAVLDTGAESPLSSLASAYWKPSAAAEQNKYGVHLELPVVPHAARRRIYRSRNLKYADAANADHATLYFVAEIDGAATSWGDTVPDGLLIDPVAIDSVPPPPAAAFGAAWDGRLWLASRTRLAWSHRGLPEQFGRANYFDLTDEEGGYVTGIVPAGDALLVIRERAVQAVRQDQQGNYRLRKLAAWGTRAGHAALQVPGVGVLVPTERGLVAWNGTDWRLLGPDDPREVERLHVSPRVVSGFAARQAEAWFAFPSDGSYWPRRGIVYHLDGGGFSYRHDSPVLPPPPSPAEFSAFAPYGPHLAVALVPNWTGTPSTVGSAGTAPGPYVWCPSKIGAQRWTTAVVSGQQVTWTVAATGHPGWAYETDFLPLPERATIRYVWLEIEAQGRVEVYLQWAINGRYAWNTANVQYQEEPDLAGTAQADPTFSTGGNLFTPNASRVDEERVVRLRFDVSPRQAETIAFRVYSQTGEPMVLRRFGIEGVERPDRPRRQA